MTQPDENKLTIEAAYELLAGRLSDAEAERIRRLCREDARSAAVLAEAEAVTEAMRPPTDVPSPALTDRIVAAHRQQSRRRWRWAPVAAVAVAAAAVVLVMVSLGRVNEPPVQPPPTELPRARTMALTKEHLAEARRLAKTTALELADEISDTGRIAIGFVRDLVEECDISVMVRQRRPLPESRTSEGEV